MTTAAWIGRNRLRISTVVVVILATFATGLYAIANPGNPARHARLNDAGVWVSTDLTPGPHGTAAMFGEIDVPAAQFSATLTPPTATTGLDIIQLGEVAAGVDTRSGTLTPVDPYGLKLNTGDAIKLGSAVAVLGGDGTSGVVAVTDPAKGLLWAAPVDPTAPLASLSGVDPTSAKPTDKVGPGAQAAVGVDGVVHAISPEGGLTALKAKPGTGVWDKSVTKLPPTFQANLQVTSVGSRAVALAIANGSDTPQLLLPNGSVVSLDHRAPGGFAELQQPGPDSDQVLVATNGSLLAVSLSRGSVTALIQGVGKPAAPVFFQGCQFGAWSGQFAYEARVCGTDRSVKQLPSQNGEVVTNLVFRQNHEELVLNDTGTGQVWQDQSGDPTQIADWLAVQRPTKTSLNQQNENPSETNRAKAAKASDVTLGARPGRVTVLHVLDFDSSPAGTVMTVNSVGSPTSTDATLRIAPDRQSVLADLQPGASGSFSFVYDVSDGGPNISNKATVTVNVVSGKTDVQPTLRYGYTEPAWSVPANGTLNIPVLNDWRAYANGDPPALGEVTAADVTQPGASAIATADGSLVYRAGKNPGKDTIKYNVVDGDKSTPASISVTVQARTSAAVSPVAANDYVRVTVGQPTTMYPLANDLPGSDPLTPNATLSIAGTIKGVPGLQVSAPTAKGAVIVTATAPGNYPLTYEDRYGSINGNVGTIRVEAVTPDPSAIVSAAPVSVTVRGQVPALVDPLAGDFSPYGGLLTVVGVKVPTTSNLQVAVVRGAFLRVNARQSLAQSNGAQTSTTEVFDYVVTDGHSTAMAQVTVVEMPPMTNDVPVAETVYGDVRAGDSVAIPVLDSAVDPAGDTLSLVQDTGGTPAPGQLVATATTPGQPTGRAFVSGAEVRYMAPPPDPTVTQLEQVTVQYQVVNSSGGTDTGSAIITIHPAASPQSDQAPQPQDLTARVVAGGTVTIPVPTSGVDPDGDSVQVEGLGLPDSGDPQPRLGAVISYSANSITYQAYPTATNAGTDTFTYVVADTYGLTSRATVEVAVVQPTVLPAPVAHNFTVEAAPDTGLALDVVSPAHVDYPDGAPPALLDPNKVDPGNKTIAKPDRRAGWLDLAVPHSTPTETASVNYEVVADLGAPTAGTITVHIHPGYVTPPIAVDEFAQPKPKATSVDVNLLAGDSSPTGGVLSVAAQPDITNGHLVATLKQVPQVIPFVVQDSNGGRATAVAYIPATGLDSTPYWNGNPIQIPEAQPTNIDITRYVVDPQAASLHLTDQRKIWTSPTPLTGRITGVTSIELAGSAGYQGPASVTFAVTRIGDLNNFTLVTIPVIVGHPTPVLRCPTDVVDVEQGLLGGSTISPLSQCHVWVPPSVDPSSLLFHLAWKRQPSLVSISRNDAGQVAISAEHDAQPGSAGVLTVSIDGYSSSGSDMNVAVVAAPPLTVSPISVQGILTTGQPTVIDLSTHVSSPFGFGAVSIVSVGTIPNVIITPSRGTVTLSTTKRELSGQFQLSYTVTDLSNQRDVSRWKSGVIAVQFIGVPGAPTAVTPRPGYLSGQVPVTWVAPPSDGAAIDSYDVIYTGDGAPSGHQPCSASGCAITGLVNGHNYHFCVTAHNIAGTGSPGCGPTAGTPDQIPGVVTGFTVVETPAPGDRQLVLEWNPVDDQSSSDQWSYTITWSGSVSGSHVITDRTAGTYTVTGLNNDAPENFTIVASNRAGTQPTTTRAHGQSAGAPGKPAFSSTTFVPTKTASGQAAVVINWQAVDPDGPGPVTYTLVKDGNAASPVCQTQQLQCTDKLSTDGSKHSYIVVAANKYHSGPGSNPASVEAAVQPDQMRAPTLDAVQPTDNDGQVTVRFTTAPSNGARSNVHCTYTTDGSSPSTGSSICPGSPWPGYSPGGSQADSKTLTGLSSATSFPIRVAMWEDNGSTQNGATNTSGPISPASNSVNTNAPPSTPQNAGCGLNGATVQWNWTSSSTTNGRGVSYVYSVDGGPGSTGSTSFAKQEPQDGGQRTLTVYALDSHNERSNGTASITCSDAPPPLPPEWQLQHYAGCTLFPGCQYAEIRIINFPPGGTASCSATGSGGLVNWGPVTLTAGSNGMSGWRQRDNSGNHLVDSSPPNNFADGTFAMGYNNNGLTCN